MNLQLEPGNYVLAVSGGVDSIVLLHMAAQQVGVRLIVAHFDHGIRPESSRDRELVQQAADRYGLRFVSEQGRLGDASEATARQARYAFLRHVCSEEHASAIITAHHQDDVLETAILNMLRGTNRRGLFALRSRGDVVRPLLYVSKAEIITYAHEHQLSWNEDSTNSDLRYRRNYVRHRIVSAMTQTQRTAFLNYIQDLRTREPETSSVTQKILSALCKDGTIARQDFVMLPYVVAKEVVYAWLKMHEVRDIDHCLIDRLVIAGKVMMPGKSVSIDAKLRFEVTKASLCIRPCDS